MHASLLVFTCLKLKIWEFNESMLHYIVCYLQGFRSEAVSHPLDVDKLDNGIRRSISSVNVSNVYTTKL